MTSSDGHGMQRYLLLVLLWLGFATSCSPSKEPVSVVRGGQDLLTAPPLETVSQLGRIVPDANRQWGNLGSFGWETRTYQDPIPHVWSKGTSAKLTLPTGTAQDRTIRITVLGPQRGKDDPGSFTVSLNGIRLCDPHPLHTSPTTIEILAPASAWAPSQQNLLEIEADKRIEVDPLRFVGLAVASVEYATPTAPDIDVNGHIVHLRGGTLVGYCIETAQPTVLLYGGTAEGRGSLSVSVSAIDPSTGDVQDLPLSSSIAIADQRIDRGLELDPIPGRFYRIRFGWKDDQKGSTFRLDRLMRRETHPRERAPIIFISIDTLSAQHLSLYGYPRPTSPELEAFAQESIVFDRCFTNAPWTVPSYMSVLTGLYANAHHLKPSVRGNSQLWERWYLANNRWTLAEMLQANGYRTAAFVDHFWITERFGFDQGFQAFDCQAGEIEKSDPNAGIRLTTQLAREWLMSLNGSDPYFLFLHALDVHGPYTPPKPFRGMFGNDDVYDRDKMAPCGGTSHVYNIIQAYHLKTEGYENVKPPQWLNTAPFADLYDDSIRMVDHSLGEFFDWLRAKGLYDEAVIIVTADHGETMEEGDYLFGHGVLNESVVRVPLIVRMPGGRNGGTRVDATVQLVDLYPTLLELQGLPARDYLHGESLVPLLEGADRTKAVPAYIEGGIVDQRCLVYDGWKLVERKIGKSAPARLLLSYPHMKDLWKEEVVPFAQNHPKLAKLLDQLEQHGVDPTEAFDRIAREGLHNDLYDELIANPHTEIVIRILRRYFDRIDHELYYLPEDPSERVDLSKRMPDKVAELQSLMDSESRRMQEAQRQAHPPSVPVQLSAEAIESLQAIGYVED